MQTSVYKAIYVKIGPLNNGVSFCFSITSVVDKNLFRNFTEIRSFVQIGETTYINKVSEQKAIIHNADEINFEASNVSLTKKNFIGKIDSKSEPIEWKISFNTDLIFKSIFESTSTKLFMNNYKFHRNENSILCNGEIKLNNEMYYLNEIPVSFIYFDGNKIPFEWSHINAIGKTPENDNIVFDFLTVRPFSKLPFYKISDYSINYKNEEYKFNTLKTPISIHHKIAPLNSRFELSKGDMKFKGEVLSKNKYFIGFSTEDTKGDHSFLYRTNKSSLSLSIYKNDKIQTIVDLPYSVTKLYFTKIKSFYIAVNN